MTREEANGGSRVSTFSYATSEHADGYNSWNVKTIEQRKDASGSAIDTRTVYTNYVGQVLLTRVHGRNR